MELAVYNIEGKKTTKKAKLDASVFGIEPNDHAIYLDVKQYMASRRQGSHKAKERGEIAGSTRKLRKQKGSGAARVGSIKNPLFRGGGRVFGPRVREYDVKLNKKLKRLARRSALSYKAMSENIIVLDAFEMADVKTQNYAKILKNLEINETKTLVVIPGFNPNVELSSRNIKNSKVITAESINTYDILNFSKLILVQEAIETVEQICKN